MTSKQIYGILMGEKRHKNTKRVNVISPYRAKGGYWAYDDEFVFGEPFVMGSSELIDMFIGKDTNEFTAYISQYPLPRGNSEYISLILDNIDELMEEEYSGIQGWYQLRNSDHKNWLCGHLLDWFIGYPKTIFVNIKK